MNRMTRKAVIGELRELKHMFQRCYGKYPTCLEEAIDYIYQTPQPERKKGKWLHGEAYPHHLYCSVCYRTALPNDELVELWGLHMNYCPNCGAKMKGEEE